MTIAEQLFKEGMEKGLLEGKKEARKKGLEIGMQEAKMEVAKQMLLAGEPIEKIKEYAKLTDEQIEEIRKKLVNFQVQLPDEFLPLLDKLNGESMDKKVRVAFAINLFVNKSVSLEKAAELSGETLLNFIDILKEQDIFWGEYTNEDKKQDDRVKKKMMKEMES